MNHRQLTLPCAVAMALLTQSCTSNQPQIAGESFGQNPPFDIQFVLPPGSNDSFAYEPVSGWPLSLRLTAHEHQLLGIGSVKVPRHFPAIETPSFVVMSNPDQCYSWVEEWAQQEHHLAMEIDGESLIYPDCAETEATLPIPWQQDEEMVKVIPGLSYPESGICGERPEVNTYNKATGLNDKPIEIGPCVGTAMDDYGYGPSGRLPGLVVVADTGPSVVYDLEMNWPDPREARNLAGFLNGVGYHLKDHGTRTSILAHVLVPEKLFAPVILADFHSHPLVCEENEAWTRTDGEPPKCIADSAVPDLYDERLVTVRAFVVNEAAPEILKDLDQDGVVTSADAVDAGFTVLSNETVISFRQVYEYPVALFFDVNEDGLGDDKWAPAGAGQLTPPPR